MSAAVVSEAPEELSYQGRYDVMGFRAEVASNAPELIAALDRLNAYFPDARRGRSHGAYEVISYDRGALWELTYQGRELCFREGLHRALSHVEWHICERAIARRHHQLHVHGAALAGPQHSVLLPGRSGIGKTTFALALALRAARMAGERPVTQEGRDGAQGRGQLRLLADDVVFLDTQTWRPECFPRAFHVHEDALPRLEPLGLRWAPDDVIGAHLCSTVLETSVAALGGPAEWDRSAGPAVRYMVFPRLNPQGPLALEPVSAAEAAVELMRYSKNLRRFPRHGLDLIPRLLADVECYVLRRNDDLAAAADVVMELVMR